MKRKPVSKVRSPLFSGCLTAAQPPDGSFSRRDGQCAAATQDNCASAVPSSTTLACQAKAAASHISRRSSQLSNNHHANSEDSICLKTNVLQRHAFLGKSRERPIHQTTVKQNPITKNTHAQKGTYRQARLPAVSSWSRMRPSALASLIIFDATAAFCFFIPNRSRSVELVIFSRVTYLRQACR